MELMPELLKLPAMSELLTLAIKLLPGLTIILAALDAFRLEAMLLSPARVEAPEVMQDVLLDGHSATAART